MGPCQAPRLINPAKKLIGGPPCRDFRIDRGAADAGRVGLDIEPGAERVAALFERRMRNSISLIVRSIDFAIRAHCCAIYRDRARSTHTAGLKTALFVNMVNPEAPWHSPCHSAGTLCRARGPFPRIACRYVVTGTRGTPCFREPTMKRQ